MTKSFYLLLLISSLRLEVEGHKRKGNFISRQWHTLRLRWTVRYSKDVKQLVSLVGAGADVNNRDVWSKNTPLHTAAYHHKIAFIKILIESGADINARDRYGFTPLHRAAKGDGLRDRGGKKRAKQIVALFVKSKVEINAQNSVGETALHLIARSKNRIQLGRELIRHKADINIQNKNRRTALHVAVLYKNIKMIKLLLLYKADTTLRDSDNKTTLDLALETHDKRIIDLFK